MKGLIKIKSKENKCFLWCHIRHLNPLKTHPERITKVDKKWLKILITKALNFLFLKTIEQKKIFFCINVFCYENDLVYPVHI